MRSKSGSAIPICRKGRVQAAAGPPPRSCRRHCSPFKNSRPRSRKHADQTRPGLQRAVARVARRFSDLTVSAERPEDNKQMSPGIRSPLKEAGFMGTIFGWMMRRFSNMAVGAGVPSSVQVIEVEVDTWLGHVRVLNVHTGIAVGKIAAPRWRAARRQVGDPGHRLCALRSARNRSGTGDILTAGMEDYRIPGIADTPDRRAFRRSRFRPRAGRQRRHRRGRDRADLAGDCERDLQRHRHRPHEIPVRPDRLIAALKGRAAA